MKQLNKSQLTLVQMIRGEGGGGGLVRVVEGMKRSREGGAGGGCGGGGGRVGGVVGSGEQLGQQSWNRLRLNIQQ